MTWRWTVILDKGDIADRSFRRLSGRPQRNNIVINGESKHAQFVMDDILTICKEQVKPEFELRNIVKIEMRPV